MFPPRGYSLATPIPPPPQTEPIIFRIEKSGRAGKTVTVMTGFHMHPEGREKLLRELKNRCGAGGTLRGGDMEIQGDQRRRLRDLLQQKGYRVRGDFPKE